MLRQAFARCVACHGGENSLTIQQATIRPKQLVARLARSPAASDDHALIESLHSQLALLTEACYECHDEDSDDPGDLEAFKRSEELYRMVGEAEVTYARTMARVDTVGRGVLLVEDEQLMMADATTAVVELGPAQHMLQTAEIASVIARLRRAAVLSTRTARGSA